MLKKHDLRQWNYYKEIQDVVKILRCPKSFEIKVCYIHQEKDKLKWLEKF